MKQLLFIILYGLIAWKTPLTAKEYHVSVLGNNAFSGSRAKPFRTIGHASGIARAGDRITVHAGVYRELISPMYGGSSDTKRVVYRAAPGEEVEIKGSEVTTGWKVAGPGIWKVGLPDALFGTYNPYKEEIKGDWFFPLKGKPLHTGQVYLNGKSLQEVFNMDALATAGTWYTVSDQGKTVIYANFNESDPNQNLTEINVRPACFYPAKTGANYITIKGFHLSQAATQWAAPTAEQIGIIGTNWSKGWIIEDNIISDSKCVGITLGKDRASGHNVWSENRTLDGSVLYKQVIDKAIVSGWNKQTIGSHVVRNNTIFNCGAAGICGSLGAAFSQITGNHIYDIYVNRDFYGAEMAGIKIHGAIDVLISANRVHHAFIGIWLDWMAQGSRVSGNLLYDNDYVDFFPEVNHGPYLVDNNIFLSTYSLRDWSEGGAYAHNFFGGLFSCAPQERITPYFKPHSTNVAGHAEVKGGDNRFYNNIFMVADSNNVAARPKMHSRDSEDRLVGFGLPVYTNAFYPVTANGNVHLKHFPDHKNHKLVTTGMLGHTLLSRAGFEHPDGSQLKIDRDYLGKKRKKTSPVAGPFEDRDSARLEQIYLNPSSVYNK